MSAERIAPVVSPSESPMIAATPKAVPRVTAGVAYPRSFVRASDLRPKHVEWLWRHRIPTAGLTILCGEPGISKSTLLVDITARVTTGPAWPDGAPGQAPADVVICASEDHVQAV